MGTTNLDSLALSETLTVTGASTLTGNVAVAGTLTTTGVYSPTGGVEIATDKKVQYRDSAIYTNSGADGRYNVVADGEVDIATAVLDINCTDNITLDTVAAKDITLTGGQVAITTLDNAASAFSVTANVGASETIVVTNTQGTGEGAITLTSTAGGIDLNAATGKNVTVDGGQFLVTSNENVASAIALTTNTGTSETIYIKNTLGTDAAAVKLEATAGGMELLSNGQIALESSDSVYAIAPKGGVVLEETADGVIADKALVEIDASGDTVAGTLNSTTIIGVNCEGSAVAGTDPMLLGVKGAFTGIADAKVNGGTLLKACTGGRVGQFITTALAGSVKKSNVNAGLDFGNQPANDGVTVVSDSAADTGLNVTIIGTTNGTDTVVVEVVVTDGTDGTTPVNSTKVDWGKILAIKADAHAGTITVSETSGGLAIKALATGTNSSGVITLTGDEIPVYNKAPVIVSDAASTKQIGLKGTTVAYVEQYDSQALNGSTDVIMNSVFNSVTEIYCGDLESTDDVVLKVGAADDYQLCIGRAGSAGAAAKDADCVVII